MASLISVSSADDPRLSDYVALTDVELRRRREPAEGIFIAEGEKVIRRAIASGYSVRSLLLAEKWLPGLADIVGGLHVPIYVASNECLEAVTGFAVHRGALAGMARKPLPTAAELLSSARRVVVLEEVNNHTNIGVVFRAAAALGMDGVLLDPRSADPLYRRSVRVSMGAVFTLPYARLDAWPGGLDTVRAAGFSLLALTPDPSATPLAAVDASTLSRCALLLGAEGDGLTRTALERSDACVRIPMANGIDSLNVGAAAAVAFYAVTQT